MSVLYFFSLAFFVFWTVFCFLCFYDFWLVPTGLHKWVGARSCTFDGRKYKTQKAARTGRKAVLVCTYYQQNYCFQKKLFSSVFFFFLTWTCLYIYAVMFCSSFSTTQKAQSSSILNSSILKTSGHCSFLFLFFFFSKVLLILSYKSRTNGCFNILW